MKRHVIRGLALAVALALVILVASGSTKGVAEADEDLPCDGAQLAYEGQVQDWRDTADDLRKDVLTRTTTIDMWDRMDFSGLDFGDWIKLGSAINLIKGAALTGAVVELFKKQWQLVNAEAALDYLERCEAEWDAYYKELDDQEWFGDTINGLLFTYYSFLRDQIDDGRKEVINQLRNSMFDYYTKLSRELVDRRAELTDYMRNFIAKELTLVDRMNELDAALEAARDSILMTLANHDTKLDTKAQEIRGDIYDIRDQLSQHIIDSGEILSGEHQDILDAVAAIPGGGGGDGFSQNDRDLLVWTYTSTSKQEKWAIEENLSSCTPLVSLYLPEGTEWGHLEAVQQVVDNAIAAWEAAFGTQNTAAQGYSGQANAALGAEQYYEAYQFLCQAYAELGPP